MRHTIDQRIVLPVFVREIKSGEVVRYDDAKRLGGLEAIDVENGEYEAWDALGRRLNLTINRFNSSNIEFRLDRSVADPEFGTVVETWTKLYGRT